jgi:hypothetical protein
MLDMREQLAEYADTLPPPVTISDVQRLVDRPKNYKLRSPLLRHPRLTLSAVAGLAVATALLIAVISVVSGGSSKGPASHSGALSSAPDTAVLDKLASLADDQTPLVPGAGQYLYVRTLGASPVTQGFKSPGTGRQETWTYYEQVLTQRWTTPGQPSAATSGEVGVPEFLTNADQAAWQSAGSPPITPGAGGPPPAPYYDVSALPTDPGQIGAYLASHADPPSSDQANNPVLQFDEATQYLGAGASAAQRAALYSFMASLPGVVNYGNARTLGTNVSGIAIGIPAKHNGETVEAIIDPSTSSILESRVVVTDPSQYPVSLAGGWNVVAGEVLNYDDYVSLSVVSSNSAVPDDAPPLPASWPFDTAKQPATSVAYPNL